MNYFLILPNQLFDKKYLDKKYNFIIYEHPHYFDYCKYNKKKLILHYSSLNYYYDYLKKNNFKVSYLKKEEKFKLKNYTLFDPIDKIKLTGNYNLLDSPNFLLNSELINNYRDKTKSFFFHYFFNWCKKELDIIPNVKSKDKENRKKLPKGIIIPNIPKLVSSSEEKYIKNAIKIVEKNYKNNYGNTNNFNFPISHVNAKKNFNDFIKKRFENFGPYEDAISTSEDYIFHSILSSSLNIGLINPSEIIEVVLKLDNININSKEGFIRQIFWREYQRYCYKYIDFTKLDYFNFKNKINKSWYDGTTENSVINNTIIKGFDNAYLHHIERLMVIGNYMVLSEINQNDAFKWFMEFPIDSYLWVMNQNVYDMVFFVGGGLTMRRPYISTSNYILKMSDYKKGEWSEDWNNKYHKFLKKYKKKLWKYRYYFRFS